MRKRIVLAQRRKGAKKTVRDAVALCVFAPLRESCSGILFVLLIASSSAGAQIAYIRDGVEVRLINSDGSNDRRLWTHPDAKKPLGIDSLAWSPDGKQIAISSRHAAVASLYDADLYVVKPDGSGFRKLTNAPEHSEFAKYPKGVVSVTVRNDQPFYKQSQASAGVFIVYVAGAIEPQQITLPPGATKTLVFNQVADFGKTAQAVVAIWGNYRWFTPGVDVRTGTTVKAPAFSITGDGIEYFGAFRPVWRQDGSRVSYRNGNCLLNSVPFTPTAGEYVYNPLFAGKAPLGTCTWDWGPTPSTANELLYTENASGDSAVFRITEGKPHPGEKLTSFSNIEYQLLFDLRWLPDASGFLFSNQTSRPSVRCPRMRQNWSSAPPSCSASSASWAVAQASAARKLGSSSSSRSSHHTCAGPSSPGSAASASARK